MLAPPSEDGKITAEQVEELYQAHIRDESFEHTVQPKMVYISNPTELGTIYTRAEMENLYGVCRKYWPVPVCGRRPSGIRPGGGGE